MPDPNSNSIAALGAEMALAVAGLVSGFARQERSAQDLLAAKRSRARAMPGADAQGVADLDPLLDLALPLARSWLNARWIDADTAKECRAAVRALPASRRAGLFAHLLALKAWFGWSGPLETHDGRGQTIQGPVGDALRFEKLCEGFMIALCETGFPVDAELASRTLDWLAHHCPSAYGLAGAAGRSRSKALGVAQAIAKAAEQGMALAEVARCDALAVFDRYQGVDAVGRDALLANGRTLEPGAKALLDISGYGRQDTFFRRMQAIAPTRAALGEYASVGAADWRLFLDFHREARALTGDVKRSLAEGSVEPNWLDDPAAFRGTFDVSDDEMGWAWWLCEGSGGQPTAQTKARPGFAALREDRGLQRVASAAFRPYAEQDLENFLRFVRGENNASPFTLLGNGVPDVDAFTFAGADPKGRFLDHLVSLDASGPSAAWLKTTDKHIARIGAGNAFNGLGRWLAHLHDMSLDRADWDYAGEALMAFTTLSRLRVGFEKSARDHGRTQALRRRALQSLTEGALYLGPCVRPFAAKNARGNAEQNMRRPLSEPNVAVARGVVWAMSRIADDRIPAMLEAAGREFYFKKFGDFRSKAAGNAVLWSLGQIGTLDATYALARLRRAMRDKSIAKLVDSALEAAGARIGRGLDDMRDLATPDYGIGPDGTRSETLGAHAVTLAVISSRRATLTSLDTSSPKAKRKRGVPKAALVDENAAALAEELAEAASDIALLLPEARARLQAAWRRDRCWRLADWRERLLDNGLVATLTRRLVWRFETGSATIDGIPGADGTLSLANGETVALPEPETRVRLWHPLAEGVQGVTAWRDRLNASAIRQPFAQAWRASYVVTAAERATRTYSNRFAGHILHQPPLIAMLRRRGWIAASRVAFDERSDARPNRLALPAFGVAAEFWFSGLGAPSQPQDYGAANYEYVTTDRLTFQALDAKSGAVADAALPLDEVPAMAFSEAMCDLESAIAATSVAVDRFWIDRGAGAPMPVSELPGAGPYRDRFAGANRGEAQVVRKAFLEGLLPSLAISERCHIAGDWLLVDGRRATYRIHLGSGASQFAANGRHLCIVPDGGGDDLLVVPSEGDTTLSLILSKAILLADDDRIEDPAILMQFAAFGGER